MEPACLSSSLKSIPQATEARMRLLGILILLSATSPSTLAICPALDPVSPVCAALNSASTLSQASPKRLPCSQPPGACRWATTADFVQTAGSLRAPASDLVSNCISVHCAPDVCLRSHTCKTKAGHRVVPTTQRRDSATSWESQILLQLGYWEFGDRLWSL